MEVKKMRSINQWSCMSENVLDKILEGATRFTQVMRHNYTEYMVLYPNGFGFSISKTRAGVDTWEIIMLQGEELDECDFYYGSEITDWDVVRGLSDEDVIEKAIAIKNFK